MSGVFIKTGYNLDTQKIHYPKSQAVTHKMECLETSRNYLRKENSMSIIWIWRRRRRNAWGFMSGCIHIFLQLLIVLSEAVFFFAWSCICICQNLLVNFQDLSETVCQFVKNKSGFLIRCILIGHKTHNVFWRSYITICHKLHVRSS